jgi:hypothetical protein
MADERPDAADEDDANGSRPMLNPAESMGGEKLGFRVCGTTSIFRQGTALVVPYPPGLQGAGGSGFASFSADENFRAAHIFCLSAVIAFRAATIARASESSIGGGVNTRSAIAPRAASILLGKNSGFVSSTAAV